MKSGFQVGRNGSTETIYKAAASFKLRHGGGDKNKERWEDGGCTWREVLWDLYTDDPQDEIWMGDKSEGTVKRHCQLSGQVDGTTLQNWKKFK